MVTKGKKIVFIDGKITNHIHIGFTPFFDNNIRELSGVIPLTIFSPKWQSLAVADHANKRQKSSSNSSDEKRYSGYPVTNEWSQSYTDWDLNYKNFHLTMRDVYGYEKLAKWILAHKDNVDGIIREDGFCTAFRHNIHIRSNAFLHKIVVDGE